MSIVSQEANGRCFHRIAPDNLNMQVRINCNDLWPWPRGLVAVQHVLLHSLSCNRKKDSKRNAQGSHIQCCESNSFAGRAVQSATRAGFGYTICQAILNGYQVSAMSQRIS